MAKKFKKKIGKKVLKKDQRAVIMIPEVSHVRRHGRTEQHIVAIVDIIVGIIKNESKLLRQLFKFL